VEANKKSKIIITLASAVIFINFIVVIVYFLLSTRAPTKPDLSNLNPEQIEEVTKQRLDSQEAQITPPEDIKLKFFAIGFIVSVVVAIIILGWFLFKEEGKIRKRDLKRKADLNTLGNGFMRFFKELGKFPTTSEFGAIVPEGIKIPSEWNFYGFPDNDVMRRYVLGWPLFDPSINPADSNQFNQYVYFLRQGGLAFDLYAHLENERDPEAKNYNIPDKVPPELGDYNFKVSSTNFQTKQTPRVNVSPQKATLPVSAN